MDLFRGRRRVGRLLPVTKAAGCWEVVGMHWWCASGASGTGRVWHGAAGEAARAARSGPSERHAGAAERGIRARPARVPSIPTARARRAASAPQIANATLAAQRGIGREPSPWSLRWAV